MPDEGVKGVGLVQWHLPAFAQALELGHLLRLLSHIAKHDL